MLQQISMRLFGGAVEPYLHYFEGLNSNLKRGMFKSTAKEYVSILLFLSMITFMASLIGGSFFIGVALAPRAADAGIYSYTLAIILSILFSGGVFSTGYLFPSMKANNIKTQIERNLPFAVFYMATTASSGIHPVDIFKALSQKKGVIGKEANKIYTNVKTLGMNLTDAMGKVANRTPSPSFADLLWGLISVITTGGSIEDYLNMKTRTFMNQYRRNLYDYAKQIALYTEIYITLVMVGSLFFIVLTAIMSPLGGMDILMLQTFVVFLLTPLVSLGFIVLLKGTSPVE
jgi:flagellar protein FlaJ